LSEGKPMELIPLSQLTSQPLSALFEEEKEAWARYLKWDYREVLAIITRMVDGASLPGFVALLDGVPAGYAFYWEQKKQGLIGGCVVRQRSAGQQLEEELLTAVLQVLKANPQTQRIEAQFISFQSWAAEAFFSHQGFAPFNRYFMLSENLSGNPSVNISPIEIKPWANSDLAAAARVTARAYENQLDRKISVHYASLEGCQEFLGNVILRPGCGNLLSDASFSAWNQATGEMAGYILTSMVSPKNGHIPQITVAPEAQGKGVGKALLHRTLGVLAHKQYLSVSLSVTAENQPAVALYRQNHFRVLKPFQAFTWERKIADGKEEKGE
jgi:ribosomal protein S18 acetylase RimI-like enzyme